MTIVGVTCSCGRTAIVRRTSSAEPYRCDDPAWIYHADPANDMLTRMWNCGRDGHRQVGFSYQEEKTIE